MKFWEKVNKQGPIVRKELGPCWQWTASTDGRYGQFGVQHPRKNWKAHILAWVLTNGPVPEGIKVCHKCENLLCVRPSHLFLGTQKQNIHDSMQKGRFIQGETCGQAKLTEAQVLAIRADYVPYVVLQRQLAAKYGVSRRAVGHILKGATWKHI
jgi:hypothetical protein